MVDDSKTFGDHDRYNPVSSLRKETVARMETALLSVSLDNPSESAIAIKQVTILRVYHQVIRIIQYLDLMDKLETKLYDAIDTELEFNECDSNFARLSRLLAIQEKLQKSIIESNKLLAPFLEMDQYPAFESINSIIPAEAQVFDVSSSKRNELRENASAILKDLKKLRESNSSEEDTSDERLQ